VQAAGQTQSTFVGENEAQLKKQQSTCVVSQSQKMAKDKTISICSATQL